MQRARLIGSFLFRVTEDGRGVRVRLQDLGAGMTLDFETWVAAWAYVDGALADRGGSGGAERADPSCEDAGGAA
jgi:hypothetical protein